MAVEQGRTAALMTGKHGPGGWVIWSITGEIPEHLDTTTQTRVGGRTDVTLFAHADIKNIWVNVIASVATTGRVIACLRPNGFTWEADGYITITHVLIEYLDA